jgi:uncharacterized Fe-S center protein
VTEDSIEWRREECVNCLSHFSVCVSCGVFNTPEANFKATNAAIADACLGAVKAVGEEKVGFINMAIDISPACDCAAFSDTPIVPNLGVFAGKDPVALDKATVDRAAQSISARRSRSRRARSSAWEARTTRSLRSHPLPITRTGSSRIRGR